MARDDKKKIFWARSDKNHFDNYKLMCLEQVKNGYIYSNLYEKMWHEAIPYGGYLRFSEKRAYSEKELAAITRIPLKHVSAGIKTLVELELIQKQKNGTIYIPDLEGRTCHETAAAQRKREQRETSRGQSEDNGGQCPQNVPEMSPEKWANCPTDIRYYILHIDDDNNISACARVREAKKIYERWLEAGYEEEKILDCLRYFSDIEINEDNFNKIMNVISNKDIINPAGYIETMKKNGDFINGGNAYV